MEKRKGEIATLLTIGALVVIGITTIISSFFLNQKKTTTSKAAEVSSTACDSAVSDGSSCPNEGEWCIKCLKSQGSCGDKSGVGLPFRCENGNKWTLKNESGECNSTCRVESTAPPAGGTGGGEACDAKWNCLGECASQTVRDAAGGDANAANWRTEKQKNCGKKSCEGKCEDVAPPVKNDNAKGKCFYLTCKTNASSVTGGAQFETHVYVWNNVQPNGGGSLGHIMFFIDGGSRATQWGQWSSPFDIGPYPGNPAGEPLKFSLSNGASKTQSYAVKIDECNELGNYQSLSAKYSVGTDGTPYVEGCDIGSGGIKQGTPPVAPVSQAPPAPEGKVGECDDSNWWCIDECADIEKVRNVWIRAGSNSVNWRNEKSKGHPENCGTSKPKPATPKPPVSANPPPGGEKAPIPPVVSPKVDVPAATCKLGILTAKDGYGLDGSVISVYKGKDTENEKSSLIESITSDHYGNTVLKEDYSEGYYTIVAQYDGLSRKNVINVIPPKICGTDFDFSTTAPSATTQQTTRVRYLVGKDGKNDCEWATWNCPVYSYCDTNRCVGCGGENEKYCGDWGIGGWVVNQTCNNTDGRKKIVDGKCVSCGKENQRKCDAWGDIPCDEGLVVDPSSTNPPEKCVKFAYLWNKNGSREVIMTTTDKSNFKCFVKGADCDAIIEENKPKLDYLNCEMDCINISQ